MLSTKSAFAEVQSFESVFDIAMRMHTALLSKYIPTSMNGATYDDTSMRSSRNLDARSKIDVADDETLLILSIRVVHDRLLISAYMNKGAVDDIVL